MSDYNRIKTKFKRTVPHNSDNMRRIYDEPTYLGFKILFHFNDNYYNKVISFYGANASGKTTVLKAMSFLSSVINNEQTDKFPISFKNKFC